MKMRLSELIEKIFAYTLVGLMLDIVWALMCLLEIARYPNNIFGVIVMGICGIGGIVLIGIGVVYLPIREEIRDFKSRKGA